MTVKPLSQPLLSALAEKFAPSAEAGSAGAAATVYIDPAALYAALSFLKNDPAYLLDYLWNLTAVDYPDRMEVVYNLYSTQLSHSLTVKTRIPRDNLTVPSVVSLWKTADFQEREVYDMFGLVFVGHPNLTRILMPDGYPDYPLRKDCKQPARPEMRCDGNA